MRKKLISVILAIAMLACMIPLGMVTAYAETYVAYSNTWGPDKIYYTTLAEAAAGGYCINLLQDSDEDFMMIYPEVPLYFEGHKYTGTVSAPEGYMIIEEYDCIYITRVAATVNGQGYMWLGEAIEAAQEGDVVRLYKDIDNIPGGNQFEAKGYTIDLNGYTLAVDDVSLRNSGYDTPVIFTDLSEGGNGTVKCNITVEDGVFLEIQKGTYDGVSVEDGASITIYGGTFNGEFYVEGEGSITIYGGSFANDPNEYAADGVKFALNKASGYYEVVHTHRAGTEYMTDGRAHWLKCDDENCPLNKADDPVLAYEIAFSSYEGDALKAELDYVGEDKVVDSMLMGRQGKLDKSTGTVSNTDGRTIIGLTAEQLDKIGNKLVIVGSDDSDENKQVSVDVDCAYTWFYDIADGEPVQVKAENVTNLNGEPIAAFVIIDSALVNDTITGFGYYRVYNDTVSDSTLLGEALYKAPRTFKAVFDTTGGANTLNFYFDYNDHAGEGKLYDNLPTEAKYASSWGYDGWRRNINHVNIDPTVIKYKGLKSTNNMFYGMENASSIKGAEYLDVSSVTDMHAMFYDFGRSDQSSINEVPAVERWNTSSVTNMTQIFYRYGENSQNLIFALDLSGWDVSHVSTVNQEFQSTARVSGKFSVTIPHYTKGLEGIKENSTGRWYTINTSKYFTPLSADTAGKRFIVAQ